MAVAEKLRSLFVETGVPLECTAVEGPIVDLSQCINKAYDFVRDAGAAFTGVLEGSVTGLNWTTIVSLAASAEGTIPPQYNLVRTNVSVQGLKGDTTDLFVAGVNQ